MIDYLEKFKQNDFTPDNSYPEGKLNTLSEQIYTLVKPDIVSYVSTSQGIHEASRSINLNLMAGPDNNPYFYRLIEIEEPLGSTYPVQFRAFLNPPTEWKEINNPTELDAEIVSLMGQARVKIIITQLKTMGQTLHDWNKEKYDENPNI